jgi:hypothetical protein
MIDAVIRAFARNKEQQAALRAHGVPARSIFMDGVPGETFDRCLATFRGRPGTLLIAHDLRVFGGTKRLIADTMARLELAGTRVADITHPEDATVAHLLQRANVLISGSRFSGDRPRARRQGRDGGFAKGHAERGRRSSVAPNWLVDRIVDEASIPWKLKAQILSPHFSLSTLRRHYGSVRSGRRR